MPLPSRLAMRSSTRTAGVPAPRFSRRHSQYSAMSKRAMMSWARFMATSLELLAFKHVTVM